MKLNTVLDKAVDCFNCGDIDGAIQTVDRFLENKSRQTWTAKYARAYLYLGSFHRFKGNYREALLIQQELSETADCEIIRGHALIEQSILYRQELKYDESQQCLVNVREKFDTKRSSGLDPEFDKLMQFYFTSQALLSSRLGLAAEALDQHMQSLDFLMALPPAPNRMRTQITTYLNMYDAHMTLGNIEQAREYMILAHAKMKTLGSPYAIGLIQLLENLASYNLFAAGSQREAIDALNQISERVVNNFADFRKVFDFFSSIIVQLHEGKIDLEKVRESIRDYGDDPLIKAYMPVLITGAPLPGNNGSDNDTPAVSLTD